VNLLMVCQCGAANCVKLDKIRRSEQKNTKRRVKKRKRDSPPNFSVLYKRLDISESFHLFSIQF
jgi:hypothetical protein